MNSKKKRALRKFLIFSLLALLAINIPLISATLLIKYGAFNFYPGEKYTLNIPFIGPSKASTICGRAEQTDGTLISEVKVYLRDYNSSSNLMQTTTGSDGKFCFTIANLTSSKKYDFFVEYDTANLTLGSNDYSLNFDNNKVYSKSSDSYVTLTGNITNKDAGIEDGRFEIKMAIKVNGSYDYRFGDYKAYLVNIKPNEIYEVPNEELNISWNINNLSVGEYKLLFKSSFNGKEYSGKYVVFNITN